MGADEVWATASRAEISIRALRLRSSGREDWLTDVPGPAAVVLRSLFWKCLSLENVNYQAPSLCSYSFLTGTKSDGCLYF